MASRPIQFIFALERGNLISQLQNPLLSKGVHRVCRVRENEHMKLVPQMARFAVVGVINTAVDLAVLNTLICYQPQWEVWASVQPLQSVLVPGCNVQQLLAERTLSRSDRGAQAQTLSLALVMRENMSTGTGKTRVVFFSTPISVSVCR